MLRSPGPNSSDPHDAHLKHLLDQRATRADVHSRVPSLSEFSDTPSLYSHAYFSPQPAHFPKDMSSNFASPVRSDRDRFNDLAVSMLEMDDEPRSSCSSNDYDDIDEGDQSTAEHAPEEDDELAMPRMSLLGPKMRFHSKAPWEMDSAPLQEEDSDGDNHSVLSSSRGKGGSARHFRFGTSKAGRSSRESSRSRRMAKKSFDNDTTSSQTSYGRNAIQSLAQASLSSTSLATGGNRRMFSSVRVRSVSPSSPRFSPSPKSPVFFNERPTATRSSSGDSESRPSFAYSVEDTHPYARSSTVAQESYPRPIPKVPMFSAIPRSETASTLTESNASVKHPNLESEPHIPRIQAFGKEISSPVSIRSSVLPGDSDLIPPRMGNLAGWPERAASPSFNLISLEEARAQRTRSNTTVNPSALSATNFPSTEGPGEQSPPIHGVTLRARARSISAGARAKQALTSIVGNTPPKPERRGSEPAFVVNSPNDGKGLKHKKSGFMRLFNSGRDEKFPPPPVPSLSEGFAAFNAQQSSTPRGMKIGRIPAPQVSPSMLEQRTLDEETKTLSPQPVSSPKRTPPPLSLVGSSHVTGPPRPKFLGDAAQSAPPQVTEFPSLKLRPISTVFSAHFGDHILPSLSDDEPDTPSSLQSPSAALSPVTPGPYNRPDQMSNHKSSATTGTGPAIVEDQSAVIRALQDQIVTAKRAWQQQIWELEGQVRDLKAEVEDLRSAGNEQGYCERCGRGSMSSRESSGGSDEEKDRKSSSVVHRPRVRTGTGQSRFGSAV